MSESSTSSVAGFVPLPQAQMLEWATTFQERSKKAQETNLSCYVRSFEAQDPFEISAKPGFLGKFFFRMVQAVKSLFGFYSYNIEIQLEKFVHIAEQLNEESLQTYLTLHGDKKVSEVFSSVRELFVFLERSGKKTKAYQRLLTAENNFGKLFAQHLIKEQEARLQNMSLEISEQGSILFVQKDGRKFSKKELFQELKIDDSVFQHEILKAVAARFRENSTAQNSLKEKVVNLFKQTCEKGEKVVTDALYPHQPTKLPLINVGVTSPAVSEEAVETCSKALGAFEQSYVTFLEQVGTFFADGDGFITRETLEAITSEVKKKYETFWDGLRRTGDLIGQLAAAQNGLNGMEKMTRHIVSGLQGIEQISAERAGPVITCLQQIRERASSVHAALKDSQSAGGIFAAQHAHRLQQLCDENIQYISSRVPESAPQAQGNITVNAPIHIGNVAPGAVVVVAANTGNIINKPYVVAAQQIANKFNETQAGVIQAVLGRALSAGTASAIYGLVCGGIPGMVSAGIASSLAVLAQGMIASGGERLGLSPTVSNVLGLMASFATGTYSTQYVSAYLRGGIVPLSRAAPEPSKPSGEIPVVVPPSAPEAGKPSLSSVASGAVSSSAAPPLPAVPIEEKGWWYKVMDEWKEGALIGKGAVETADRVALVALAVAGASKAAMALGGQQPIGMALGSLVRADPLQIVPAIGENLVGAT